MKGRRPNRKQRRIANRSGKMQCDICEEPNFLEQHHINGRKIPNPNHPSNLANICPICHTEVHYGKIIIEGWALTTTGKELLWHKADEESFSGTDSNPHQF